MNLANALERYGDQLDLVAKQMGIGAREDCAVALLEEGIQRRLQPVPEAAPEPAPAPVEPAHEERPAARRHGR